MKKGRGGERNDEGVKEERRSRKGGRKAGMQHRFQPVIVQNDSPLVCLIGNRLKTALSGFCTSTYPYVS